MAKDNLKLKVAIDGDNKGFKKALTSTQRDIHKMQEKVKQKGGLGFGDVAGLSAFSNAPRAFAAANAHRRLLTPANLAMAKHATRLKDEIRAGNDAGWSTAKSAKVRALLDKHAEHQAEREKLKAEALPLQDIKAMMPMIITGVMSSALIATVTKMVLNQNAFDTQSKGFSGAVMAHEAAIEARTIRRNLKRAKSPTFIAQQKRYAEAEYYSNNGSTTTNGRNVATDVATAWEYLKGYVSTNPDVLYNPLRTNYDIARGIF